MAHRGPPGAAERHSAAPVLFEIFGEIWAVRSRLGQGVSASVYRVSSGRAAATAAAVKEFRADPQGVDYGYRKERSVLEDIQGHKNIGTYRGVLMTADLLCNDKRLNRPPASSRSKRTSVPLWRLVLSSS